ncbi:MAG: class I SAM-dependent methyltransferase [Promethearchaeota archaeon]
MKKEIEIYSATYGHIPSIIKEEKERISYFISKIPTSKQILEIGCADGRLLDLIDSKYKVGVDISINALKHVNSIKYAANVKKLPFADNSFELVICSEVLEHLNDAIFQDTLKEMNRISSKYIMISVPYKEQLFRGIIKCHSCDKYYHLFLHKRSFSDRDFLNKFPNFKIVKTYKIGNKNVLPQFLFIIKNITQNYINSQETKCPYCGSSSKKNFNVLRKMFYLIEALMKKVFIFKREANWIILIYLKKIEQIGEVNADEMLICPLCQEEISIQDDYAACPKNHKFYYRNNILDFRI